MVSTFYFSSLWLQVFVLIVSVMSCVYYIIMTYQEESSDFLASEIYFEFFFFLVFSIDYILSIIFAISKFDFIFSLIGIADFCSLLPILPFIFPQIDSKIAHLPASFAGFLRFFRLFKFLKIIQLRNSLIDAEPHDTSVAIQLTEIWYQVSKLIVSIFIYVLLSTGLVFCFYQFDPNSLSTSQSFFGNW